MTTKVVTLIIHIRRQIRKNMCLQVTVTLKTAKNLGENGFQCQVTHKGPMKHRL